MTADTYRQGILAGKTPRTFPPEGKDPDERRALSVERTRRIIDRMQAWSEAGRFDAFLDRLSWGDRPMPERIEWTSYYPNVIGLTKISRGDPREDELPRFTDWHRRYPIHAQEYGFDQGFTRKREPTEKEAADIEKRRAERKAKKDAKRAEEELKQAKVTRAYYKKIADEIRGREAGRMINRAEDQHSFVLTRRVIVMDQFKISEIEARVYIAIMKNRFMWRGEACGACGFERYYSGGDAARGATLHSCACSSPNELTIPWASLWGAARENPDKFGEWARDYAAPP